MRAALGSIALVVAGCSTAPPAATHPPAAETTTATATSEPPPFFPAPALRAYTRTGAPRAIVQDPRTPEKWALSPDGRLLAKAGAALSVFDLDRRETVLSTLDPDASRGVAWVDDDALIAWGDLEMSAYDGKTGALVGRVRHAFPGAVRTPHGLAALRRASNYDDVELVRFSAPDHPLLTLAFAGASVDGVLDLGSGAFAAITREDVRAFDVQGKELWRRGRHPERDDPTPVVRCPPREAPGPCVVHVIEGTNWRVLSAVDGATLSDITADDVPVLRADGGDYRVENKLVRVKLGADPVRLAHDVPGASLGASPDGRYFAWSASDGARVDDVTTKRSSTQPRMSLRFGSDGVLRLGVDAEDVFDLAPGHSGEKLFETRSPARAEIVHVGGGRFEATCANGARAALPDGANDVAPSTPSSAPGYGGLRVVSPDKKLLATSTEGGRAVTLSQLDAAGQPTGSPITLDAGGPTLQLAFTSGSDKLVTAEHLMLVGMSHHVDDGASVRVFDTKDGKLLRSWVAHGFQLTADGSRILTEMDLSKGESSVLYDMANGRELARWDGIANDAVLSPRGTAIYVSAGAYGTVGPVERTKSFVDAIGVAAQGKKSLFALPGPGAVAFDPTDRWLAYAEVSTSYEYGSDITLFDLSSAGTARRTERLDVRANEVAFASSRVVFGRNEAGDVQLLDVESHRKVSLRAFDDGERCRFVAVDDEGRFQGDAGPFVAARFGDDLRASEISRAPVDVAQARDEQLLQRFLAPP